MYMRPMYHTLWQRLQEPRSFIQILAGPRQVGKTTLGHQVMDDLTMPAHFASADDPGLQDTTWIQQPAKPFASCIANITEQRFRCLHVRPAVVGGQIEGNGVGACRADHT